MFKVMKRDETMHFENSVQLRMHVQPVIPHSASTLPI